MHHASCKQRQHPHDFGVPEKLDRVRPAAPPPTVHCRHATTMIYIHNSPCPGHGGQSDGHGGQSDDHGGQSDGHGGQSMPSTNRMDEQQKPVARTHCSEHGN